MQVLCFGGYALLAQPHSEDTGKTALTDKATQPQIVDRVDRLTLIDGSVLVGQILQLSDSMIIISVSGSSMEIDPAKVERVERNVPLRQEEPKIAEVITKDDQRFRGTIKHTDGQNTYLVSSAAGNVSIKNSNIKDIYFIDAEKARQKDAIAARPGKWELSLKGGSPFYQLGKFQDLLAPGYMGFLQVEAPYFMLPGFFRLGGGLMAGYVYNTGKGNNKAIRLELLPALFTLGLARQIAQTPLDGYLQLLVGSSLTRGILKTGPERLALDIAYGTEVGMKYFITKQLTVRLGSMWFAVQEGTVILNHLSAYMAIGWQFY